MRDRFGNGRRISSPHQRGTGSAGSPVGWRRCSGCGDKIKVRAILGCPLGTANLPVVSLLQLWAKKPKRVLKTHFYHARPVLIAFHVGSCYTIGSADPKS